jgi:hypothetical protein
MFSFFVNNKITGELRWVLVFLYISAYSSIKAQDFYINSESNIVFLNNKISPEWENLNISEAYEFLSKSGFSEIKKMTQGAYEVIYGVVNTREYTLARKLMFSNKEISLYSDFIEFFKPCTICLSKKVIQRSGNNPAMADMNKSAYNRATRLDEDLKAALISCYKKSLISDSILSPVAGEMSDYGFKFNNSLKNNQYTINRSCTLELDQQEIYHFTAVKQVVKNDIEYKVSSISLPDVNYYDLQKMVDIFLTDCKNHGIIIQPNKISVRFEKLSQNLLGVSYGMNKNAIIDLVVDPEQWQNASPAKRWYLIYHELGHDVLNLEHGQGGKMMFTFADRGYSWKEFWADKEYMFEFSKKGKK